MVLSDRVVAVVKGGRSQHAQAPIRVSLNFINDLVILKREPSDPEACAVGIGGRGAGSNCECWQSLICQWMIWCWNSRIVTISGATAFRLGASWKSIVFMKSLCGLHQRHINPRMRVSYQVCCRMSSERA